MSALKIHVTEEHHSNAPEWLEADKRFIAISPIARDMYRKIRKRYMVSVHNAKKKKRYIDTAGEVFCLYTIKDFMSVLGVSNKTVIRAKRELKKVGLIREVRQGVKMPNMFYLLEDEFYKSSPVPLQEIRKPKTNKTTPNPCGSNEVNKGHTSYKENKTSLNNKNIVTRNSSQTDNLIDLQSYKSKKPLSLEQKIIEFANKQYTKFAIGRWSKKDWNTLIAQFASENAHRTDIENLYGFIYGSLKKMAKNRDEKLEKRKLEEKIKEDIKNTNYDYINETMQKLASNPNLKRVEPKRIYFKKWGN